MRLGFPARTRGAPARALFSSAALLALISASAAAAQGDGAAPGAFPPYSSPSRVPPPLATAEPASAAPVDDGLKGGGFYLEADELIQNEADHTVVVKGSVEARYKGRVLRADEVDYNRDTGIVVAKGNVRILEPDGTSQFASYITLDKDMKEGVAIGFSTRLSGDVKIAAASVVRRADEVTDLNRAIYTPCPVCADNAGKPPSWSIRAKRVIEDKKRQRLIFHDAVLEVKNIPVLYLPIFLAADPSAPRKSGFLLPIPAVTGQRGLSLDIPYYQVLSPSADITISPQFNTKVNPFLNIDLRKRFWSGTVDVRAGYTYDQDFTSGGQKFGPLTSRSYILADGDFTLSPTWSWGFTAEQASDKLIFDKYSIGDVFVDRGLYAADDRRLISQLYAIRQNSTSYLSIAALSIEGLRASDEQSEFPIVAPLLEFHYDPQTAILGGRLRIDASGLALTQDRAFGDPSEPGVDERRASADIDWRRTFTLVDGLRLSPFLWARGDLYNIENYPAVDTSAVVPRAFGTVGLDADWPFFKVTKSATWIVEPMAQLAISPNPS
ncbi:MAG: LPS-assembly protein LptD, partial [Caulobacteraceae bacterium]